jgi:predicted permease
VISLSAVAMLPFHGNAGRSFQIEGRPPTDPEHEPSANYSLACPDYFRTMGIAVLKGREFTHQDTLGAPEVIVINEAMAHQFWPAEDPIGKSIRFGGSDAPRFTIVGVVANVHYLGLDSRVRSQFMRPYTQAAWPMMTIVVRTVNTPLAFTEPVKKAMREFLPDRPVSDVDTMENIVKNSIGSRRVPMLLLSAFSVVALLLASVGIMGVVSYSVTQRTQEIGLRMALGARGTDVFGLVLGGSMKWVLAGLAFGLAGSAAISRVLGTLLYEVRPADPEVLGIVSGLLIGVALLASFVPARRAANLDPIRTLRNE